MPPADVSTLAPQEFLRQHVPFSHLSEAELSRLGELARIVRTSMMDMVLGPGPAAEDLYVVRQGRVEEDLGLPRSEDVHYWDLREGDCFPLGSVMSGLPVSSLYQAREDTICYAIPRGLVQELIGSNPAFRDFCMARVAALLEQSKQVIQAQHGHAHSEQQAMNSPLSEVVRRAPVTCPPDTPIAQVLETMHEMRIGSMLVTDSDERPLGIFTLHDVLSRVALVRWDLSQPISSVMSSGLVELPPDALAYEAALTMARHGFRHVPVVDAGRLVGVVSEKDLFSLQRVGLRQISTAIRSATGLPGLQQASRDIRSLAHSMLSQGVAAEQLTQFISTLNDLLTCRVIQLEWEASGLPDSHLGDTAFCWIALGSEGRFEQTLNTDQDNGIIFTHPKDVSPDSVRERLLPLARRINETLDVCGFPLCKGDVMASNPAWCLSLDEWKARFSEWIHRGDAPVLLNSTIFFDFRPLYGAFHLSQELRGWLNGAIKANRHFLRNMMQNALGNEPPLGFVRDFVVDGESDTLDLKVNGITPFVDAARIFALAAGLEETSTIRRLRGAGATWNMDTAQIEGWIEAFLFIQLLRLRLQHQQARRGEPLSNRANPHRLNDLDRRILKEAFKQAKKLQGTLEKYFQY